MEKLDLLAGRIAAAVAELKQLRETKLSLEADNTRLAAEKTRLEEQCADQSRRISTLEGDCAGLAREKAGLEADKAKLQEEFEFLQLERDELQEQLRDALKVRTDAEARMDELNALLGGIMTEGGEASVPAD